MEQIINFLIYSFERALLWGFVYRLACLWATDRTIRRPNIDLFFWGGDFFGILMSIFGPWVKKSSILEVGFEFSMKNCIFSQLERSGGQEDGKLRGVSISRKPLGNIRKCTKDARNVV